MLTSASVQLVVAGLLGFAITAFPSVPRQLSGQRVCPGCPAVGDIVPELAGRDLQGREAVIRYAGHGVPTVLYNFVPFNQAGDDRNLVAVIGETKGRFRFVFVTAVSNSRGDVAKYITSLRLPASGADVISDVPAVLVKKLALQGTPRTDVVSPDGRLLETIGGPWGYHGNVDQVERVFGVRLPDRQSK